MFGSNTTLRLSNTRTRSCKPSQSTRRASNDQQPTPKTEPLRKHIRSTLGRLYCIGYATILLVIKRTYGPQKLDRSRERQRRLSQCYALTHSLVRNVSNRDDASAISISYSASSSSQSSSLLRLARSSFRSSIFSSTSSISAATHARRPLLASRSCW